MTLKKTCLHSAHIAQGARMVDFGGWHMPVQYTSITKEHEDVRQRAGLFDVSHMGTFEFKGAGSQRFLQSLVPNNIDTLYPGKGLYTQLCQEDGATLDDILIFQVDETHFLMIVNASNREKDFDWIQNHLPKDVTFNNIAEQTAILALQGPLAQAVLQTHVSIDLTPAAFKSFEIKSTTWGDTPIYIARSGYTGEDGFEIYAPIEVAPQISEALLSQEVVSPIGLGARDTLRLEAALPLYGHELDEATTPFEAGMGWSVKLKPEADFIGKTALKKQKVDGKPKKRVGFILENTRRAPRQGYRILHEGAVVGVVTSGSLSPTLDQPIGLGFISLKETPDTLDIEVRNQVMTAKVVKLPFYRRLT